MGRAWSQYDQKQFAAEWQAGTSLDRIGEILCRSRESLIQMARKVGLPGRVPRWTNEEDETISDCWQVMTSREIAKLLSGRSPEAIRARAGALGLDAGMRGGRDSRIWTVQEERRLRQLCSDGKSLNEIAILMDRSKCAVQQKRYHIGIPKVKQRRLTAQQKAKIVERYLEGKSAREVADEIGCSARAVTENAKRLGVTNGWKWRPRYSEWGWTGEKKRRLAATDAAGGGPLPACGPDE